VDGSVIFVSRAQKTLWLIKMDGKTIVVDSGKAAYVGLFQTSASSRCARCRGVSTKVGMWRFRFVSGACGSNQMMDLDLGYNDGTRQC
jgi:hypothetical protein